jgi:hypothetical protein
LPVFGGEVIVLKVPSVACENRNRLCDSFGKTNAARPSATTGGGKISRNVLRDGVVEVSVPAGICKPASVAAEVVDRSILWALVEIVILLKLLVSSKYDTLR